MVGQGGGRALTRPILDVVAQFLTEDDWPAVPVKDAAAFRVRFGGTEQEWTCLAIAREEERQFVFYSALDSFVPPDDRQRVGDYLMRANWGMAIGNWEMDPTTGEIRYKTSIDVADGELTLGLVKGIVYTNVRMVERYLPGLRDVLAGSMAPAAAVQRAEGD